MADMLAKLIVDRALALQQSHPQAAALDTLDLVMLPHACSDIDFGQSDQPGGDWTDPRTPFGVMLAAAFDPLITASDLRLLDGQDDDYADAFEDHWHAVVLGGFAERYNLWNATPDITREEWIARAYLAISRHRDRIRPPMAPEQCESAAVRLCDRRETRQLSPEVAAWSLTEEGRGLAALVRAAAPSQATVSAATARAVWPHESPGPRGSR